MIDVTKISGTRARSSRMCTEDPCEQFSIRWDRRNERDPSAFIPYPGRMVSNRTESQTHSPLFSTAQEETKASSISSLDGSLIDAVSQLKETSACELPETPMLSKSSDNPRLQAPSCLSPVASAQVIATPFSATQSDAAGSSSISHPSSDLLSQSNETISSTPPDSNSNCNTSTTAVPPSKDPFNSPAQIPGVSPPTFVYPHSASIISDAFRERYREIVNLFRQNAEEHPRLRDHVQQIDYTLKMCGPSVEKSHPSILVFCHQSEFSSLHSLLNSKHLKRQYGLRESSPRYFWKSWRNSPMMVPEESHKPLFKLYFWRQARLRTLLWCSKTRVFIGSNVMPTLVESHSLLHSGLTLCGSIISVNQDRTKTSTLGCIIQVGSEFYGLTAAHAVRQSRAYRTPPLISNTDAELGADLDGPMASHDLGNWRNSFMACQNVEAVELDDHSTSEVAVDESVEDVDFVTDVEYEDLLEDDDDHGDDSNDFDGSSDPNDLFHEDYLISDNQEGMIETQALFSIEYKQGASKTLDFDWALISLPERGQWRPNAFMSTANSPRALFFSEIATACPEKETEVLIITSGNVIKQGTLQPIPSFLGGINDNRPSIVWSVTIPELNRLTHGDSGSIVIDARTNVVYGHVVASNPLGEIYISPIVATLEQIQSHFPGSKFQIIQRISRYPEKLRNLGLSPDAAYTRLVAPTTNESLNSSNYPKFDYIHQCSEDSPSNHRVNEAEESQTANLTLDCNAVELGLGQSATHQADSPVTHSSVKEESNLGKLARSSAEPAPSRPLPGLSIPVVISQPIGGRELDGNGVTEATLSSKLSDEAEADSSTKPDPDATSPTDCRIIGHVRTRPQGFELDLSSTYNAALSKFPSFQNDTIGMNQDPEELPQQDIFPMQVWRSLSMLKQRLPNQERMANLTWRMMHINLRKPKEQEESRWNRTSDDSIVGPSETSDLGRKSKQKVIQPDLMELDVVTGPESIPLLASVLPNPSSEATQQADRKSFSPVIFQQSSGYFPPESVAAPSYHQSAQAVFGDDAGDLHIASPLDGSRTESNPTTFSFFPPQSPFQFPVLTQDPKKGENDSFSFTSMDIGHQGFGPDGLEKANLRRATTTSDLLPSTTTTNRLTHMQPIKHELARSGEQGQSHALPMIQEKMSTLAADEHEGERRADTNRHVHTQSNVPTERNLLTLVDKGVPRTCMNCFTQTTPLWRRDPDGHPLCNACGLFLKLHGVVRPLSLKIDVIKKRRLGSASMPVGGTRILSAGTLANIHEPSNPVTTNTMRDSTWSWGAWNEPAEESPVPSTQPTSYEDNASSTNRLKGVARFPANPAAPAAFPEGSLIPGVAGKPQSHHRKSEIDNEIAETINVHESQGLVTMQGGASTGPQEWEWLTMSL
ncbi:ankyrin repeat domain-containing protein [Fusarium bulbicola]|nr:ankyrin repeat domain-containing protein [Fusarium bulbicola]